ncbi:MAG: hypothetical protein KC609_09435, partial [Myxococcales bacterium]|nr:hypothetical protein [Myxococcales bacterium]
SDVLLKLGRKDDATEAILDALQLQPQLPYGLLYLGKIQLLAGDLDRAKQSLARLRQSNIGSWDRDTIPLLQGEIALFEKRYDAAERFFRHASAVRMIWDRDPNDLRENLARVALRRRAFQRCEAITKAMLTYRKNDRVGTLLRARCADAAGRRDDARLAYARYIELMKGADANLRDLLFARRRLQALKALAPAK